MSSVEKEVTINDLSSHDMTIIVRRGGIEDIVSKERISRHFGSAVDHVLATKKSITVRKIRTVIKLTKRMPRLRKLTSDRLRIEHAERLARNNQGIVKFAQIWNMEPVAAYIKCVKQLIPEYTASEIRNLFDGIGGDNDELYFYHPDLQFKTHMKATDINNLHILNV